MRTGIAFLLLACIGCTSASSGTSATVKPPANHKPTAMYKGITAEEWSQSLYDADDQTVIAAVDALGQLGDTGKYYLIEGIQKRPKCYYRLFHGLNNLNAEQREQLTPIIKSMLNDKEDAKLAVYTLAGWGKDASPLLLQVRAAVKRFPDNKDLKHWATIVEANVKK